MISLEISADVRAAFPGYRAGVVWADGVGGPPVSPLHSVSPAPALPVFPDDALGAAMEDLCGLLRAGWPSARLSTSVVT